MKWVAVAIALCVAAMATPAVAQPSRAIFIDRAVVRFESSELGAAEHPRFIFERVLAFEARLEALAEAQRGLPYDEAVPYEDRHIRSALERHVTEEILASLPMDPPLSKADLGARQIPTLLMFQNLVGGRQPLLDAALAEGLEAEDLDALVERRARASLYLDRMVAPMLNPSDAELREVHRTEPTPFRNQPFAQVIAQLRPWYISNHLSSALAAFFRSARARIRIVVLAPPG